MVMAASAPGHAAMACLKLMLDGVRVTVFVAAEAPSVAAIRAMAARAFNAILLNDRFPAVAAWLRLRTCGILHGGDGGGFIAINVSWTNTAAWSKSGSSLGAL